MIGIKLLVVLVSTAFLATGARIAHQGNDVAPAPLTCGPGNSSLRIYQEPNAPPQTIRSYNYPGHYGNNEECRIEFYAKDETMILELFFNHFSLVESPECSKDSLCIDGFTFCHNELDRQNYIVKLIANRKFTLVFRSNSSITSTGFEIMSKSIPDHPSYINPGSDICAELNQTTRSVDVAKRGAGHP